MRSFDETVTIEELYDRCDQLEWLESLPYPHDTEAEVDGHWNRVFQQVDGEYWEIRARREPMPW